jgi:GNAT superfamily N-acetyltransferase
MTSENFVITLAKQEDIYSLPEIERRAGLLFKPYSEELGLREYYLVNSVETLSKAQQSDLLWVAKTSQCELVGFALVIEIEGFAHLEELDVLPSYGRQGVGSALLLAVCTWAKAAGYPALTLRTFCDIPWNQPFYQRRGFRIVDSSSLSAGHVELEVIEKQLGLRTDVRVTMTYDITV